MSWCSDVRMDAERYSRGSSRSALAFAKALLSHCGLQATVVFRFGKLLQEWQREVIGWPVAIIGWCAYMPIAALMKRGYGIRLALSAEIGPGFYIGHFGGIEIVNCEIGRCCSISQQVKIGSSVILPGPKLGDRVWVGALARIADSVEVGSGSSISAGSHVGQSIPAGALVSGNPARVVRLNYDNSPIIGVTI